MGLQMIVISLAMIMMISMVNAYGFDYASAYGAALQLWPYIQMPAMAIGAACSSMAAQHVGAGQWDRLNATARTGTLVNFLPIGSASCRAGGAQNVSITVVPVNTKQKTNI